MLRKYLLIAILFALTPTFVIAQFSDVRGTVKDIKTSEPLAGSFIQLLKDGVIAGNLFTDENGDYVFLDLAAGKYVLKAKFEGYQNLEQSFYLQPNESKFVAINLVSESEKMDVFVVRHVKLEEPPVTQEEIENSPYVNLLGALQDPALTKRNGRIQFSDARPEQTQVIKDNVSQIGPFTPTTLNVGQIRAISSGVPAMYGDFIGGAIEYTSSTNLDTVSLRKFMLRTSSPFNAYHQNGAETFLYKPLKTVEGYTSLALTHSLFLGYNKDPNPASIAMYQLSEEDKLKLLEQPFSTVANGTELPASVNFDQHNFEKVRSKQNTANYNVYTSLKLDWKPNHNLIFKLEPSIQYTRGNSFSFSNSLLNAEHNPLSTSIITKLNAQMVQNVKQPFTRKGVSTYDSSLISRVNYVISADYQRVNSTTKDPIHGNNIFNYGYMGSFKSSGEDVYEFVDEETKLKDQNGNDVSIQGYYKWLGHQDTGVNFTPSNINKYRSSITEEVFRRNHIQNLSQLSQLQGLLNGQNATAIGGMWYAPGTIVTNFSKSDVQKSTLTAIINLGVNPTRQLSKQHDVQIGMVFENRKQSYYSLNANSLWQLMPQLLNGQYTGPDLNNPILTYDEQGVFTDSVKYNWLVDQSKQSNFDRNLRSKLSNNNGYHSANAHFIDINSVNPNILSIDMFSADELWNNGNSYVNYAGYDYKGNLVRGNRGIGDFLNDKSNRSIGAYNPNYSALWLQDKWVLEKIKIRAGVRIERFDANQLVLSDRYSLYPVKTVGEVHQIGGSDIKHPGNVGDDYKVYVDNMENPQKIVGYRKGDTWLNEQGIEVQSAEYLRIQTESGVIQPYLVDPSNQRITPESFKDYDPELIVLPRLTFSFPIKSDAMFYAYYDKFAQRPNSAQSFAPINSYYYLENASSTLLPNPELKASKRTDYKFGYKQLIGFNSTLNLTAGYAEIRNDINLVSINQAYPRSYITYGNIDFSTIKSFKAEYQLTLPSMRLKGSYLLQFADGTGSNVNSAAALIQANQPNLRSLYPLEYDIRHKFNASASISLDSLAYNTKRKIYRNVNISIFSNTQSGTPYTALITAVPEAQSLGNASRSQIKGNPFGSRMPWNSTIDISVSKGVIVREKPLIFQLSVTNVFNFSNIFNVYPYSSLPTDDGYLSSPQGQQQVSNELNAQSFVNYYSLKQNNPANFGQPRMISLTCRTTF